MTSLRSDPPAARDVRDLDAAAADVDDDGRAGELGVVAGRQVDEPRFLAASDDPRGDAGLGAHGVEEDAAVLGLARRARGGRDDLVHAAGLGQPPELGKRLDGRGHRLRGERLAVQAAGAQPHHHLLAIDHFEGAIGVHLHDDHVHGVGADVDGGDAHGARVRRV